VAAGEPAPPAICFDASVSLWYQRTVVVRSFLLAVIVAVSFSGCETLEEFLLAPDDPPVVYVREPVYVRDFDPYYNRPKIYWQPEYYHESTTKKTKGKKVFKTTTITNQYGDVVYKHTKVENKKKSKKKKKK
jgi:hypothetical protein